jgi:hypothetical protein
MNAEKLMCVCDDIFEPEKEENLTLMICKQRKRTLMFSFKIEKKETQLAYALK